MYSTRCAQESAADAVQIFGGRSVTQTGMGRFIEHYHRTIPFDALLGGGKQSCRLLMSWLCLINVPLAAEDVLGDLGVRQAMRAMPKNARL